jgi:hypothetical protein
MITYPHRKALPVLEKGWTHEIEEPYRRGSCFVLRFPFAHRAIALGVWREAQDEEQALTAALWGRHLDVSLDELLEWD